MHYYSLRGDSPLAPLEQALLEGLAPDGGLYFPTCIPRFPGYLLEQLREQGQADRDPMGFLQETAFHVMSRWFGDAVAPEALWEIVRGAQSFPLPVRPVGPFQVLELFHGPTMAFKDVAARYLARLMDYYLTRSNEHAYLLVATSGDTGGAIATGFAGLERIQVVVLFPKGKVSKLQEEQLTRTASNVIPVEVEGVFDDCQALVKQAFVSPRLEHLNLTSANSINIGRLIPQIIPYVYAYLVLGRQNLEVVVPSGNFGNLTAALFAREMGLPLPRLVAATNANDATVRYFHHGQYQPQPTVQTLSTAMDVGAPSNFDRVRELYGNSYQRVRQVLRGYAVTDEETVATIRRVYESYEYLLCPHSAVAWAVAERCMEEGTRPLVVATASPIKFAGEIQAATGIPVDDAAEIERLRGLPARKHTLVNDIGALEALLLSLS